MKNIVEDLRGFFVAIEFYEEEIREVEKLLIEKVSYITELSNSALENCEDIAIETEVAQFLNLRIKDCKECLSNKKEEMKLMIISSVLNFLKIKNIAT